MNRLTAQAILVVALFSARPLLADAKLEAPFEEIEIFNNGRVIKTISAKLFIRKDLQWISIKVNRRDFTVFPSYSHLHVTTYDAKGKPLKTDYRKLSEFDFPHTVTGRHRNKTINYNMGFQPGIVAHVSIQSYEQKHDHQ